MAQLMKSLLRTTTDPVLLIARVALGTMLFAHGAQKVLGLFGGRGLDASFEFFSNLGIPTALAGMAIGLEFVGGPMLIIGLLGRVLGLGTAIHMGVTAYLVAWPFGFFMNWTNTQRGEGIEFHLIAIALALTLVAHGSGPLSVDRALAGGSKRR
jgi:putative oxidoreductase